MVAKAWLSLFMVAATVTAPVCAAPGAAGEGVRATPDAIPYGKAASVTLRLPPGADHVRAAVTPWQPAVTETLRLDRGASAAAAAGGTLAVAGAGGVTLWDPRARPAAMLGRFPIDDACPALQLHAGVAYVACRKTGLWLLDIRDPRRPGRLARIPAPAGASFGVAGHYLAVLHGKQVVTYDISAPATPGKAARYTLAAAGRGLAMDGRRLFIAQGTRGLAALRLGKDGRLAPLGRYPTTTAAVDVTVDDGIVYVALGSRGVVVLDATDPSRIRWLGSYHRLGRVKRLRAAAHRLYAVDDDSRVYLLDTHRPARPAIAAARRFAAPVRDLAVAGGGRAWVLTRTALSLTDFAGPVPAFSNENLDVGEGVNFGGIRRGVLRGDVAYTADWFSGIHLFDIKDPARPRLLSSLHIPGSAKGIAVKGKYAFVADDDHGLQVVDVNDPFRPAVVARLDTPGLAYIPFLAGNRLYLASHGGGFQIIDVSAPRKPRLLATQATPDRAWAIRVRGDTAFVADDRAGLLTFDVHDPRHIRPLGAFRPGGYAEDVALHGDYALVAFFDQGLYVVDIRDPRHPQEVAHLAMPGNARGLDVQGNRVYVADWLAGVQVVDLGDPRLPRLEGGYDTDGAAWGVRVKGHYAYVMDWWGGFTVLDVADPARPRLAGRYHDRGSTRQLIAGSKFLYEAAGRGGLQVFDRKTALNPIWVTGLDIKGRTSALWRHGRYLYAAGEGKGGGLTVVDNGDPYRPRPLGHLTLDLAHPLLQGDGKGRLYLYSRGTGISVIDASDPRAPRRIAVIGTPANDLWVTGDTLYVAAPRHGVQAYDVSHPEQPRPLAIWPAPGPATAVTGRGSRLFVAVTDDGLYTLKVGKGSLTQAAHLPLPGTIGGLAVAGDHLLATRRAGGLWDVAVGGDGGLRATAFYPILHTSTRVSVAGGAAYVSGGSAPTAVSWFPGLKLSAAADRSLRLSVPATLPRGGYGVLLMTGDGRESRTPLVLRVQLPQRSDRPFTMKDFRKAYKAWRRSHP